MTVSFTPARWAGTTRGVYKSISANDLTAVWGDRKDRLTFHLYRSDPTLEPHIHTGLFKGMANRRFDSGNVIQTGMAVMREVQILVQRQTVSDLKESTAAHSDHFFSSRVTAVIAHDTSHQTGAEKHISPF
jgi:hypothetical protein